MSNGFDAREESYFDQLKKSLDAGRTLPRFNQTIVDAPFADPLAATYLELSIIVLLKVDKTGKYIKRVALSNTEQSRAAQRSSEKPLYEIEIPLSNKENSISKAIRLNTTQHTDDWNDLFVPAISAESSRFNQTSAGIAYSVIEPVDLKTHFAALIFSFFQHPTDPERTARFTSTYAAMVSQALIAKQKHS